MSFEVKQHAFPLDIAVSARDLIAWKADLEQLRQEQARIAVDIERLERRLQVANDLFELLDIQTSDHANDLSSDRAEVTLGRGGRPERKDTVIAALRKVVEEVRKIAPYQAKEILKDGPLGEKLNLSDKGFYHAIARLVERGVIVRHNGWLFTPDSLKGFMASVATGTAVDDKPTVPTRSPLGDAVIEFVKDSPGVTSRDVISHLRIDPEFNAAMTPNTTIAYNVISRLVRRNQLEKIDGRYYLNESSEG